MTQHEVSGKAVAERVRASELVVGNNNPVEAMLANSLRERKPLADDGSLYDTVQAAENAASSFVFVPPGTFNEAVTIDTAGLTLLGSGRATHISAGSDGNAITAEATNVMIRNLSVSTAQGSTGQGITGTATRQHVENCVVRESGSYGINFGGADSRAISCTIESFGGNGGFGTDVRATIVGNTILQSRSTGDLNQGILSFNGADDSVICGNIIFDVAGDGIEADGNDCLIGYNRIHNAGSNGIALGNMSDGIVFNNRVSGSAGSDISSGDGSNTLDGNLTGASN